MSIILNVCLDDVIDYLDSLIEEAEDNLKTYEEFDGEKFQLYDFRKMEPFDAFLYGVANGKKDVLDMLIKEVEERADNIL